MYIKNWQFNNNNQLNFTYSAPPTMKDRITITKAMMIVLLLLFFCFHDSKYYLVTTKHIV